MSSEASHPLAAIAEFGALQELEQSVQAARSQMVVAESMQEKRALHAQIKEKRALVEELSGDENLHAQVGMLGQHATQALAELHLDRATLPRRLFEERVQEQGTILTAVAGFFDQYGDRHMTRQELKENVAGSLAVAAVAQHPLFGHPVEKEMHRVDRFRRRKYLPGEPVQLSVYEDVLFIGENRRSIAFETDGDGLPTAFGERCRAALLAIVDARGKKLKPSDVWRTIYGDSCPYDTNLMLPAIAWLEENIKHDGKQLVQWNGLRGRGSRYFLKRDFNPQMTVLDLIYEQPKQESEESQLQEEQPAVNPIEVLQENKGYLFMAAFKLHKLPEDVIDKLGFRAPDPELLSDLKQYLPNLMELSQEEKDAYRENAIAMVQAAMESDALDVLMQRYHHDSPEKAFVEYLADQQGHENGPSFSEVLGARLGSPRVIDGQGETLARGAQQLIADNGSGKILWSSDDDPTFATA